MRECFNGFDIFEIVRKKEEYLYMTHEELFQKKLETDKDIIQWKNASESEKYFDYVFPDPSTMYSLNLIESAIISIVIDYKRINVARLKSKQIMKEDKPEITEFLITAIKEDPKISYRDLIDLGSEKDEFEMYLEKLIEDRVISRRGKSDNKFWRVNKK
ncbi:MAG: hypothetical protein K2J36_05625 [Ruminococcus sp.]|nr:hypothetical protein [Ruminococcus sp.]MDE6797472.1 hypothetical protein [Ruminococcus sp.]